MAAGAARALGMLDTAGLAAQRIILLTPVIGIEELLEPLDEFEIILEPSFHKSVNGNNLVNIYSFECVLQHFEVVDILVLQLGVELDLLEHHRAGEQHVHELAVDGAGAELLDLGVLGA